MIKIYDNTSTLIIIMKQEHDLNKADIDISQKRLYFEDPQHHHTHLLTNILIYAAAYYPHTKKFIFQIADIAFQKYPQIFFDSIKHLHACLEREVIYGPSSSFVPPSQIQEAYYQDIHFTINTTSNKADIDQFSKSLFELGLDGLIKLQRLSQLIWYNSKLLSLKSFQNYQSNLKLFRKQLEIDGQSWLQSTPFPSFFCLIEQLIEYYYMKTKETFSDNKQEIEIRHIYAKTCFLHNKILQYPVKKFCTSVLVNYVKILKLIQQGTTLQSYVQILLQYSYALLFYYKYNQAEEIISYCCSLMKVQMEFTGKLGRRTKYQSWDTAQLVMNVKEKQQNKQTEVAKDQYEQVEARFDLIDAKQLVLKERGLLNKSSDQKNQLETSPYEQDSILLQKPKFVEDQSQNSTEGVIEKISEVQLLSILSLIHWSWKSNPHEQMLYQNIAAAIDNLLSYKISLSYSTNFSLLLLRSLNQFPRLKHMERAIDQLEKLKNFYNTKAKKDVNNLYSTPYQTNLSYVLILAGQYMQMGLSLTAVNLFERAGLFEECVDTLIKRSYKQKALQILNKLIQENGNNPRLLCMLGDLNPNETKYYEQAWELSKNTNARSMRSLGWHYFNKGNYEKACQSFEKATQASYYHPNTWFTLGCSYMRLNKFTNALKAFSECISIDDSQGQAWGNMASCYIYEKKIKEAYSTLQQAVKYSEGNWKLWANLLNVSLTLKKFYKYFECIERIVKLDHSQILSQQILKKLTMIMRYQNESQDRKRIIYNFKNRIDRLFQFMEFKIGQNPLIWQAKTNYQIQIIQYIDILHIHYSQLHRQNKLDINDLIPGYQTMDSTNLTTKIARRDTKAKIVECKQTHLNMVMKIGWQSNKLQGNRVKSVLFEYVDIYRQYSLKQDKQDFQLFVKGIVQKLEYCLQQKVNVNYDNL